MQSNDFILNIHGDYDKTSHYPCKDLHLHFDLHIDGHLEGKDTKLPQVLFKDISNNVIKANSDGSFAALPV